MLLRLRSFGVVALAACGCGDNLRGAADAGPDAAIASAACRAAFSGDFVEVATGSGGCPTLTHSEDTPPSLAFRVPSQTLQAPLVISIELSSPATPGVYSSETTQAWSAVATSSVNSGCVYAAGDDEAPTGSFELALASVDPPARTAHGTLTIQQYVRALVLEDCGSSTTEAVELEF